MKTKHLLTALALPAVFAACTSEDVFQSEGLVKEDLGNRPVVEGVTLSLGGIQSKAAIQNWGTIDWEDGDKLGVALIDVYSGSATDPIYRYNLLTNSINTNYIFTSDADGNFTSEASMVEGNYAFYYPYNTQRTRNQLLTNLPKEQALTQLADGTYSSYPSVLAYSEENGAPMFVAYDFLSAADAGNTLEGTLKSIYATPLFTIQNICSTVDAQGKTVSLPMTIKQISLSYGGSADNKTFVLSAPLKFASASQNAYTEADGTDRSLVANLFNETIPSTLVNSTKVGSWISPIKGRHTSEMIGTATATSSEIILTLAEPVTVAADGSFSFYAVIPAEDYSTNKLNVTVMDSEGLSRKVTFEAATLTAGQRYPEQEINDDNTLNNDIKGMSLTTAVDGFDTLEGVLVSSVDELINAIKNFTPVDGEDSNTTIDNEEKELKVRVSGDAVINKRVTDFLKLTTTKAAKVTFVNDVTIEGAGVVFEPKTDIEFSTKATAVSGAAVSLKSSKVSGNLIIAEGATATYEGSDLTAITNNGTLNMAAGTSARIQNNNTVNVTSDIELAGDVTNGKYLSDSDCGGVEAELNVPKDKTLTVGNFVNAPSATINNLGTIEGTLANKGKIVNGGEDNIDAVLDITSNDKITDAVKGSIENYAKATVATLDGEVEMMSVNAVLSASAGSGLVDNDELAAVEAGTDVVVTYTVSGTQTEDTIDAETLIKNGVTKVIFDGVVLNLNGGLALNYGAKALDVEVKTNSSVNSKGGAAAGYALTLGTSTEKVDLKIESGKALTVNAGTLLEGNYSVSGAGAIVNNGAVATGINNKVVYDAATLATEIASGGNIVLGKDMALPAAGLTINENVVLSTNGKKLSFEGNKGMTDGNNYSLLKVNSGAKLTIMGDGTFDASIDWTGNTVSDDGKNISCDAINVLYNAEVTIEGGTFKTGYDRMEANEYAEGQKAGTSVVQVQGGGKLIINGGSFEQAAPISLGEGYYFWWVINPYSQNIGNGDAEITINAGTFKNWNPAGGNFDVNKLPSSNQAAWGVKDKNYVAETSTSTESDGVYSVKVN